MKKISKAVEAKAEASPDSWWSKVLNGLTSVAGVAAKILPMFLSNVDRASFHNMKSGPGSVRDAALPVGIAQTAEVSAEIPPSYFPSKEGLTLARSEYLQMSQATSAFTTGQLITSIDLNPRMAPWLAKMANYERYRIKHVAVKWQPALATTTTGGLLGVYEWDVDNLMKWGSPSALTDALSHQSAMACDMWSSHAWVWTNESQEWLYVADAGRERRLIDSGRFSLASATAIPANTADKGFLSVLYVVEFKVAELQPFGGSTDTLAYDAGSGILYPANMYYVAGGTTEQLPSNSLMRVLVAEPDLHSRWIMVQFPRGLWRFTIRGKCADGADSSIAEIAQSGDYVMSGDTLDAPVIREGLIGFDRADAIGHAAISTVGGVDTALFCANVLSSGYTDEVDADYSVTNGISFTWQTDDTAGHGDISSFVMQVSPVSTWTPRNLSISQIVALAVDKRMKADKHLIKPSIGIYSAGKYVSLAKVFDVTSSSTDPTVPPVEVAKKKK